MGFGWNRVAIGQSTTDEVVAKGTSSARWVPLECDFYEGHFHLGSQWEGLRQSAWASRLQETKLWQTVRQAWDVEWRDRKSDLKQLRATLSNPVVADVLRFATEVVSDDVFVFADERLSTTLVQANAIQSKLHLLASNRLSNEEKGEIVYGWIDSLAPEFQFPTLAIGGRVRNADRAATKVDEIEGLLRLSLGSNPDLAPVLRRLQRIDDARGSRLHWSITGADLPWSALGTNDVLDAEALEDLRDAMQDKHFSWTVGVLDGFFVFMVSGHPKPLERFGSVASGLTRADWSDARSELIAADSDLGPDVSHLRYVSDSLASARHALLLEGFFEKISKTALQPALESLDRNSDLREWLVSLADDAPWLDRTIARHVPEARGALQWTVMREDGWETRGIDRTRAVLFDGRKPLEGLQRLGNRTLIALDLRLADHPEYFQTARQVVRRIRERLDGFVKIDAKELGNPEAMRTVQSVLQSWPTLRELADLWEQQWLPSLGGEYVAAMQMGGLSSRRWHPALPKSETPLVLPEFGVMASVRDVDRLRAGAKELRDVVLRWMGRLPMDGSVRERVMDLVPTRDANGSSGMELFRTVLPLDPSLAAAIQPSIGLGKEWLMLAYSADQIGSFQSPQPLAKGGFAMDASIPAASAAYIDVGGILRELRGWLQFGLMQLQPTLDEALPLPPNASGRTVAISPSDVLEFWDVLSELGEFASMSHIDGDERWHWKAIYRQSSLAPR